MKVFEVVKVVELEPISAADKSGVEWLFRIEILKDQQGLYRTRLWEKESCRLHPCYPMDKKGRPKEVNDAPILWENIALLYGITGKTANEALQKAVNKIHSLFGLKT